MFTVVLTDDENASDDEEGDTTLYNRNIATTARQTWNARSDNDDSGSPANDQWLRGLDLREDHDNRAYTPLVGSPNSSRSLSSDNAYPLSSAKTGDDAIERRRKFCCPTNAASAFAVLFLSVAAFPVQFPDGAFPTLRSAADAQLRAVMISATAGAIVSALCLDYCDAADREPRRRHVFYRRTLVAGSLCVALFAFFRCIPDVPIFVSVVAGFAAGVGLAAVVRLTSAILLQPTSEYDDEVISASRWSRGATSSSAEVGRRCLMEGIVAAAYLGAPLISAGVASALIGPTSPIAVDAIVSATRLPPSMASTSIASRHLDLVVDYRSYPFGSDANVFNASLYSTTLPTTFERDIALNASSVAFAVVSTVGESSSTSFVDFSSVKKFESINASSVKWAPFHVIFSGRHLVIVIILFVCSIGAFILAIFAVTETSGSTAYDYGDRNQSLLRGATLDDASEAAHEAGSDRNGGWRERLVRQLSAYGRREVALLFFVALFVGSQQMLAYFVFVRVSDDSPNVVLQ